MLSKGFGFYLIVFILLELCILMAILFFQAPWWLLFLPFVFFLILLSIGSANIQSQFYIKSYCQGEGVDGLAISFDDGPDAKVTPQILEILKEFNVPATFFVIGNKAQKQTSLLQKINAEGHLIGNHSYTHPNAFAFLSRKKLLEEMEQTNQIVKEAIGKEMQWFRPPFGVLSPRIAFAVGKLKMSVIGWSIRSLDTKNQPAETIFERVKNQLESGKIILFHDRLESTCVVLRKTLEYCKDSGIKIVSLEEMIKVKAYG